MDCFSFLGTWGENINFCFANSVDQDETGLDGQLIWVLAVWRSVFEF